MISNNTLKTVGVIQEKTGRYIYAIPRKNLAYVVPKNKLQLFFIMKNRFILIIIAAFFINTAFFVNTPTPANILIQVGIVVFLVVLFEYYFRKLLLGKFVRINNYKVVSSRWDKQESPKRKWFHAGLYISLAAAIVYLGFSKYSDSRQFLLFPLVAIATLVLGYYRVFLSKKKK